MPTKIKGNHPRLSGYTSNALMGIQEIADFLGISYNLCWRWIQSGRLPAVRTGDNRWYMSKDVLMTHLQAVAIASIASVAPFKANMAKRVNSTARTLSAKARQSRLSNQ